MKREAERMREADVEFRYSWGGRSEVVGGVGLFVVIVSRDAILSVDEIEEEE